MVCLGQTQVPLGVFRHASGKNMTTSTDDRWLSVDEIAEYLGIKRDTVYKWIDRKHMPAHKLGSLWKFKKEEIDDWVRSGSAAHKTSDHDANCQEAE